MKIIYVSLAGKKRVRYFDDWSQLCEWLRFYYPLIIAQNQVRSLALSL